MESMSNNANAAAANTAVANNGFLNKMGNVVSNHGKLSFVIIIVLLVVIIVLLYRSGSLPYFSKKDESDSSSSEKADESIPVLDQENVEPRGVEKNASREPLSSFQACCPRGSGFFQNSDFLK